MLHRLNEPGGQLLLLLVACLLACLLGSVSAEQGRKLTATPLNCQSLHDRCSSCAMATKPGTKISYVKCTKCDASPPGYTPYTNMLTTPTPKSTCGERAGCCRTAPPQHSTAQQRHPPARHGITLTLTLPLHCTALRRRCLDCSVCARLLQQGHLQQGV